MPSAYFIRLILNSLAVFKATLGSAFKLLHHIHAYISVKCLCSTARKARVQHANKYYKYLRKPRNWAASETIL